MKIRIGLKIFVSFFVITFLIILVSIIGLTGMDSIRDSYGVIVNESLPVETLIKEARAINLEQVAAVRGFMIYRDEQYPKLYNDLSKELEDVYAKIAEMAKTTESQEYLNRLKAADKAYSDGVQVVFDYVRKGQLDEAVAYGEKVKVKVTEIKEITKAWSTYVGSLDIERINQTDKQINARITFLFVLVAIAVLSALGAGFILTRNIAGPIKALTGVAGKISEGDLTQEIPKIKTRDEVRELGSAFAAMVANLRGLIINVNDASQELVASSEELAASSEEVSKVSEQIADAVSELAEGASEQAHSSEKGNARILQTVEGLSQIAEDMAQSEKMAEKAKEVVEKGEASVKYQEQKVVENNQTSSEVAAAISELSVKSAEIGQILEVIKSIAEQTNLLALNAAIEAARAGEAGKGFSVVADEIRKLAEQSGYSVKQIDKIIKEVQEGVNSAVAKMDKSRLVVREQAESLENTVAAFRDVAEVVGIIRSKIILSAEASSALSKNAVQAGEDITAIACVSQQTAASTQEVAASTQEQASTVHQITDSAEGLSRLAVQLQEGIGRFKL
ncbi:methyl-accepting chemotaxis protein McpB [Ruminiclostridium hungatei]|uniref:Methyl-accepting chemotaxis protein McpB n=1 Tax=Ruminiclostridium hungatei TaxID=48256 RepID=A0A1V4SNY9_RUMHU|nr:methyl-accepting chemotaxis protein [Ruminiclostridium hungatei]OPX45513.1 methyl-accepting chemotaxis protein McpB [Ruminiclostridium hungatei]